MEQILSVGIDLGTTTTQMILSRLTIENTAAAFAVPRMEIRDREILFRSEPHFTPLLSGDTLDAEAIAQLLRQDYEQAGIQPAQVQTGAVIITGETARKENAQQVLRAMKDLAGEFVVATAGPALESVLAARGAGADRTAKARGRWVLNLDMGGGTTNLALFDPEGTLRDTGCLNIGGRLLKLDSAGTITYVSPVLSRWPFQVGQTVTPEDLQPLVRTMVRALEAAAGRGGEDLTPWITDKTVTLPSEPVLLSFSGGVADLIGDETSHWLAYGDLGVLLGRAIGESALYRGDHVLGQETLRATVVGAGSYATELSGSTIAYGGVRFPMQDVPFLRMEAKDLLHGTEKLAMLGDGPVGLALEGALPGSFDELEGLADRLLPLLRSRREPVIVALEQDLAKALGQALRCRMGADAPLVCLDGIHVPDHSYVDLAAPVAGGAAIPVVVKTLAF